jgi:serine/threonine protein kinase
MLSAPSSTVTSKAQPSRVVGRYVIYDEIASGGMATVHFGRLRGDVGFSRTVAIKSLHAHFARDTEFISMFLDEARLVSRIQHPNVAAPLDVVLLKESEEIFLVMEYIHGETLARMLKGAFTMKIAVPAAISASIMSGALHGLHAAHEATDELGSPLNIVHRDVSPHNIMVGVDGVPRVLDFGVAKAVSRSQSTRQGQLKGKVSYMSPEQMGKSPVDRRADIFAAGIVFWEALTLRRLFEADDPTGAIAKVLMAPIDPPSTINPNVSPAMDRVVLKALNRDVNLRYQTAREFAEAIEEEIAVSTSRKVGEWVVYLGGEGLAKFSERLSAIESSSVDANPSSDALEGPTSQSTASQPPPVRKRPGTYSDIDAVNTRLLSDPNGASGSNRSETSIMSRASLLVRWLSMARKRWPVMTGAALVVATVVVVVGLVGGSQRIKGRDSNTIDSGHAANPIVEVTSLPTLGELSPPAPATTAAPGEVPPRAPANPRRASAKTTTTQPSPAQRQAKSKDCNPPFYLDGKGIRRVKPQCL